VTQFVARERLCCPFLRFALEVEPDRGSPWFILAFAVSCALGSVYGFLQGAWPFGVIEAIWGPDGGVYSGS
jgi:hypothetical protein